MFWMVNVIYRLLVAGELLPCSRRWGWEAFADWAAKNHTIVTGYSHVNCRENVKACLLCRYENSTMDFSFVSVSGSTRSFQQGFLTTFGELYSGPFASNNINAVGKKHVHYPKDARPRSKEVKVFNAEATRCDEYEERPVFVLSNDDTGNIGHYMNDVATIWNMLVMWGIDGQDAVMLNFDGLRNTGPAGVSITHRLFWLCCYFCYIVVSG
jgi:hypothetical protein